MNKSRYSDSRIMAILEEVEAVRPVSEMCREHGVSSATRMRKLQIGARCSVRIYPARQSTMKCAHSLSFGSEIRPPWWARNSGDSCSYFLGGSPCTMVSDFSSAPALRCSERA
jgi:hypothetical protein